MNRSGLVAAAKDYLNRSNVAGVSLSYMIESVEGELNRALREHPRNLVRVNSQVSSAATAITVPDDLLTLAQVRRSESTGAVKVYTQFPYNMRDEALAHEDSFINRGTQLELFHGTTVYPLTIVLDYYKALTSVAPDTLPATSSNWVLTYYADVYLYGVLKEAAIYVKDAANVPIWSGEFQQRVGALVEQGNLMRTANSPRVLLVA